MWSIQDKGVYQLTQGHSNYFRPRLLDGKEDNILTNSDSFKLHYCIALLLLLFTIIIAQAALKLDR